MKKAIIFGSTGMIGNVILKLCLENSHFDKVICVNRRTLELKHEKLLEIIHEDFTELRSIEEQFKYVDVGFFCLGVYTGAVPDNEFREITVDYAQHFADALKKMNPESKMCFLSGAGADRKEKSRMSFAKYKGMAENYLLQKGIRELYIFRPSYIYPVKPRKEPNFSYRLMRSIYPLIKAFGKKYSITSEELGKAIYLAGVNGAKKNTLENADIHDLLETS